MKTIYIKHPHDFLKENLPETVMALGYFDGIHFGHQEVIIETKRLSIKRSMKSAVMTFDPHPSVVLGHKDVQHVEYITPLADKEKLIEELGIDFLYVVHFDKEFASLLPQQFVDMYIVGLNIQHIVAGFDFSYGRLGMGTMDTLPLHSRGQFTQTVIEKVMKEHEKISSTFIRNALRNGNVDIIPSLLGRFYSIKGTVIHGEKRGRTIGFPTANVQLNDAYVTPMIGVYAVQIKIGETWYNGVCNVGFKPTFHDEAKSIPTIEVHIFDFKNEVYGEKVSVEWHLRLRSEKKFANVADLINQIQMDQENALKYFSKHSKQTCILR
jgi:riboflavin kinase/FMN adenylyltransferase